MKEKKKTGAFLLLLNLGLLLVTTLIIGGAYYFYTKDVQTVTISENRFLTMEWHLLQELKAETDREILEKDREIARLRAAYNSLRAEGQPEEVLEQALSLVEQAEEERKSIWENADIVPGIPLTESAVLGTPKTEQKTVFVSPGNNMALVPILLERVEALESELAATREHPRALQAESAVGDISGIAIKDIQNFANRELSALRTRASLDMAAIRTRSLLRALVSTPEIQSEYPDLLKDLEKSYEDYGRDAHVRGQREALVRVLSYLQESQEP